MSSLKRFLDRIMLLDLLAGLGLTFKHLFREKVTVQYPEERWEPAHRFRGMFRLDEDRCIKCTICARDCPIDIIYIDVHDDMIEEGGKKKKVKVLDRYDIDVKRCMFCSLCEEACPTKPKSIWLTSKTYELATYDRNDLYFNMQELEYWDDRPRYTGLPDEEERPQITDERRMLGE